MTSEPCAPSMRESDLVDNEVPGEDTGFGAIAEEPDLGTHTKPAFGHETPAGT